VITVFNTLIVLSSVLFLWYGLTTLFSNGMLDEFSRFGLTQYRRVTGGLEVLGALGLLGGLRFPPLIVVSAAGLSLMMLLGVVTRVRVRDPWLQMLPAVCLMLLNAFLAIYAVGH
jgi:DoxX-like family